VSGLIKICGLSTPDTLEAAIAVGADMVGLVHFPRSPRHVGGADAAALADRARGRAQVVLLLVDPDDASLEALLPRIRPDLLQLHGHESPQRVAQIRQLFGLPVMKAVGIAGPQDVAELTAHAAAADRLLVDAKPPSDGASLPGGNGLTFDWRLVAGLDPGRPMMLSGGLTAANVGAAIELTGLCGVDVSSSVESTPGVKDIGRIAAFVAAAREAFSRREAGQTQGQAR
jgi:phosphoribosylanthranilate isomerase